jgi:4-carboxymuconolactone decarboxylase
MARIPPLTDRDPLEPAARDAFDRIVASRGSLLRPFETLLHAPAMADAVSALGHVVRYEGALRDRDRELATIATGRAQGCAFVWSSHLEAARDAGVAPATIAALERGTDDADADDAAIVAFVRELCASSTVSDGTFARVHGSLGDQGVVELAVTVGYYTMLAYTMGAVETC